MKKSKDLNNSNKNHRVCILSESFYPSVGGMETQAKLLAEELIKNNVETIILTRKLTSNLKKREKIGDVLIIRIPPAGHGNLKRWQILPIAFLYLIILRNKYEYLMVSGFKTLGISAVIASKLLKKKCILKADNKGELSGEFFEPGLRKLRLSIKFFKPFLLMRNWLLKKADFFVSISSQISYELIDFKVPKNKIINIPNGVDIIKFCPVVFEEKMKLRHNLGISKNQVIAIYTGRLAPYKGVTLLVNIWKKIVLNHPEAVLYILGGGEEETKLKYFVKYNKLETNVIFTDNVENVDEYLKAADIFVFPSKNEAFGISLIEAMACGLPVITTLEGGIKDIISNKNNGIAVPANDFIEFYDAVNMIIEDKTLAASLGKEARKTVEAKYSIEIIVKKYLELFEILDS